MTSELNLNILTTLYYSGTTQWNYKGIIHSHNTVYFILGGNGHIRCNNIVTDMQPGCAYLIPPHQPHDIWCDTHIEKVYVDFHMELLPGHDIFSDTKEILCQTVGMKLCQEILNLCEGSIKDRLKLRGILSVIFSDFLPESTPPVSAKMLSLLPIISDIQENLSSQIRREELAQKHNWNPSVLSRTFKEVFGCGVKQYAERLLVTRLAEELMLTNKPLKQLAEDYNFCDAYYLSAFFKRNTGISPSLYRKK